jgi:hypothetical protein
MSFDTLTYDYCRAEALELSPVHSLSLYSRQNDQLGSSSAFTFKAFSMSNHELPDVVRWARKDDLPHPLGLDILAV